MRFFLPVLMLCLMSAVVAIGDEPKSEENGKSSFDNAAFRFDGVWKPKGAMLGGVLLPPPALKAITLTIDKDKYEVSVEGEEHSDVGTFTLDPTTTPKRMTIKSTAGPNKGKTFFAIYEIKNADAMRVCYDLSGTDFPKEFKAPKGSQMYLVGYRRQVPDAGSGQINSATKSEAP
ncbi:TIGR03067 domain-containing protein [Novipirellula rosea]